MVAVGAVDLAADKYHMTMRQAEESEVRNALSEVELELRSGPWWRIYETALQVADAVPAFVDVRSKAERGFALAGWPPAAPARAQPSAVRPGMSVSEAFAAVALACLTQYHLIQHGLAVSTDIEYLHQARVALRRLRSAFTLFRPAVSGELAASHLEPLRALARALGPARDWDVFAVERLPQIAAGRGDAADLRGLIPVSCSMNALRTLITRPRTATPMAALN